MRSPSSLFRISMGKPTPFGLGATAFNGEVLFLPLEIVSVDARIFDVSALVQLEQRYINPNGNGLLSNAQYVFPIPGNAAVCEFKMKDSDGRVVSGVVKETEEAKQEFQDAVDEGKWAGVAYEITADVFCISIGAIRPGLHIKVILSYSMDIPENECEKMDQIRFALPTFIGERYGHAPAELSRTRSDDRGASFTFTAKVKMTSQIMGITSPSHPNEIAVQSSRQIRHGPAPLYATQVHLLAPMRLDRDFILSIQAEKLNVPRCFAEIDNASNSVALMLTLVPRLGAPDVTSQEYIFVLDRSGSMSGENRIEYAKETLKHLMAGLPTSNSYFNIVSFGMRYAPMWNRSVEYLTNKATAVAAIDTMSADMGGTEIGGALDWAYRNRIRETRTAVIVLTDGEVGQPESVINSVREMVGRTEQANFFRVFTVGIGNGASEALCSGLARVGNGVCFMTTRNEEIIERCSRILRAARTVPLGVATDFRVDWGFDTVPHPSVRKDDTRIISLEGGRSRLEISSPDVLQAPTRVPNLYDGNRFTVYAILSNTSVAPSQVVLCGTLPSGDPVEISVKVVYFLAKTAVRPPLLHTLAAKRFIRELEDGDISGLGVSDGGDVERCDEIAKAVIVDYGSRYSLASRFTSFVAVEEIKTERGDEGVNDEVQALDVDTTASDASDGFEMVEESHEVDRQRTFDGDRSVENHEQQMRDGHEHRERSLQNPMSGESDAIGDGGENNSRHRLAHGRADIPAGSANDDTDKTLANSFSDGLNLTSVTAHDTPESGENVGTHADTEDQREGPVASSSMTPRNVRSGPRRTSSGARNSTSGEVPRLRFADAHQEVPHEEETVNVSALERGSSTLIENKCYRTKLLPAQRQTSSDPTLHELINGLFANVAREWMRRSMLCQLI
ncbi:hypothetical protein SCHPADRAFT_654222 [Schizopora paradoxa]|uniref:VWA-like protein n=1 Tax=Schizopora paradoxa TaxID=27342 RepID=A0A0H2R623_9AGAM|nr:hypothetical protein SCHPADRAFT_654222 [Schizopora paradoxa]